MYVAEGLHHLSKWGAPPFDLFLFPNYKARERGSLFDRFHCSTLLFISLSALLLAMRLSALFSVVSIAVAGVASSPLNSRNVAGLLGGADLSPANCYGAPNPPWILNSKPGWYYGNSPGLYPDLPSLIDGVRLGQFMSSMTVLLTGNFLKLICFVLELLPLWLHCPHASSPPPPPPPAPGSYTQMFYNLTGATQAADYLTYGLVDTVDRRFFILWF